MLTDDQVRFYRENGFLKVSGLVSAGELRELRAATDRVTAAAVEYGKELDEQRPIDLTDDHGFDDWREFDHRQFLYARDQAGKRIWRRAEGMWKRDPIFRIITANPGLLELVAQVHERDDLVPSNDSMVVKMPGGGAAVPWHRDPPGEELLGECGDATADFTCDIYVDRATVDNGCIWAIAGSHRDSGPAPDPLNFDVPGAVPLEAEPGDVVLHSTGVLHGSPPNHSAELRRTFYLHYGRPERLMQGWWSRSQEWVDGQRELLHQVKAERAATLIP
jgi:phytanoyl-CoA hydroxylase